MMHANGRNGEGLVPFGKSGGPTELTASKNARSNSTLRKRGVAPMAVLRTRMAMWNPERLNEIKEALKTPTGRLDVDHSPVVLSQEYLELAKSQEGEFRKDLVEAYKGMTPQSVGLSIAAPDKPAALPAGSQRGL